MAAERDGRAHVPPSSGHGSGDTSPTLGRLRRQLLVPHPAGGSPAWTLLSREGARSPVTPARCFFRAGG